jgi:hypothetical protein
MADRAAQLFTVMDDASIDVAHPACTLEITSKRGGWRAAAVNSRLNCDGRGRIGLRVWRASRCPTFFSHAGGSIPYLAARFAVIDEMGFIDGGERRGSAADMFRRMYWDMALAASDPVLRMLRDVAGIKQVLHGTDFPYLRRDLAVESRRRLLQTMR